MDIKFTCDSCHQKMVVDSDYLDAFKEMNCPECKAVLKLPKKNTLEQSVTPKSLEVRHEKPVKKTKVSAKKVKNKAVKSKSLKAKNVLKKNRRKASIGTPMILMALILLGAAYYVIQDGTIFRLNDKPVVVKKAPEPVKKKVKKKEKPKVVEVVEFKPLPKMEEKVDMHGHIAHLSFKDIMEDKCISCHGAPGEKVEGKFNLLKLMASQGVHNKHWAAVYKQIESGEMPPEDERPLTEDEKLVVLSELRQMTSQTAVARKTRALTPDEIKNTLVDIFQIDEGTYNPFTPLYANYAQNDFYSTQKSVITPYYLDDLYETLHDALESYVSLKPITQPMNQAAAFPGRIHLQEKVGSRVDLRWGRKDIDFVQTQFKNLDVPEKSKKKVRNRDIVGPDSSINKDLAKLSLPPGTYKLSFDAQTVNLDRPVNEKKYGKQVAQIYKSLKEKHDYSLPVEFFILPPGQNDPHARRKFVTTVDVETSEMSRYTVEFTLDRRNGIGYRFPLGLIPGDSGLARMIAAHRVKDRPVERKDIEEMYDKFLRVPNYEFAQVRFKNVKIEGPFDVQVSPYSVADAERLNNITIRKKFRTLHNENLIQMNMSYDYIFDKFRQRQIEREESYRNSLVAFFLSTEFLTLNYDTKDKRKHARMLSYVFHKSTPSPELNGQFEKALKMRDTSEFSEWLVNHPHFNRFVASFTKQWLHLSAVNEAQPDRKKFRQFYDNDLMPAYTEEAKQFLLYLFRENRPVKELVAADYSVINNNLISFYDGGRKHEQDGFKKYSFSDKSRGGILASGAFLTATGNGVEQLPIKRAEWILTNLLDSHLPPPPDDINLENFQQDLSAPLHKRLAAHSENAACYSCHKKIDPLAIMMNGFNTIGGHDYNGASNKVKLNDKILRNFSDFKNYLGTQEEALARSFTKSILRYSLGRDLYVQDAESIDKIIEENRSDSYPMKNMMKSIIKYYFFN